MKVNEWIDVIYSTYKGLELCDISSLLTAIEIVSTVTCNHTCEVEEVNGVLMSPDEEDVVIDIDELFPYGRGWNCILDVIAESDKWK